MIIKDNHFIVLKSLNLCPRRSYITGRTEVQAIPSPNANSDLIIRSRGRSRFGENVHRTRPPNHIEAIPVPARRHHRPNKGHEQNPRGGERQDGGVEAPIRRPPPPAATGPPAARNDAAQRMAAAERATREIRFDSSSVALRALPSPVSARNCSRT